MITDRQLDILAIMMSLALIAVIAVTAFSAYFYSVDVRDRQALMRATEEYMQREVNRKQCVVTPTPKEVLWRG